MKRRVQWLMVPSWIVLLILLLCAGFDLIGEDFETNIEITLLFSSAIYAAYRALRFNPLHLRGLPAAEKYVNWLIASPWQVGKPLPAGPAHLVWQDAFLLASFVPVFLAI